MTNRTNITIRMKKSSWKYLVNTSSTMISEITGNNPVDKELLKQIDTPEHTEGRGYVMDYTIDGNDGVINVTIDPKLLELTMKAMTKVTKIVAPLYSAAKALGSLVGSIINQFKELTAEMKAEYHSAFDRPVTYGMLEWSDSSAIYHSTILIKSDGYCKVPLYTWNFAKPLPSVMAEEIALTEASDRMCNLIASSDKEAIDIFKREMHDHIDRISHEKKKLEFDEGEDPYL